MERAKVSTFALILVTATENYMFKVGQAFLQEYTMNINMLAVASC